ncbi:MAG TPA: N-acetyl-gamma-glutamyl-phosphate reductase [Candidatus Eisenbacteria bacterium]|nr:N-acetyl-gamma-glutamyl-phosphate reductase [Candidatus Eisenbacteria bacterium]
MGQRIQPAVIGATGYSGFELVRLLARHAGVRKPILFSRNGDSAYKDLSDAYPQIAGNGGFPFENFSWQRMKDPGVDVLFLATPHEFSREIVPDAIAKGFRVIDLSGAWRLKDETNRAVYGFSDADAATAGKLDSEAVYGLPELHADEIKGAALLANPGCYPTSIILALAPWIQAGFVDLAHGVICDSKSGVSGAGKSPSSKTHFVEVDGDFAAYNVFGHRHTGEMLEQLGLDSGCLQFTPHLLPIARGILSTIYVKLAKPVGSDELEKSLHEFYAGKPWVRIFGATKLPQIKFSRNTNFCDIGFSLSPDGTRAVLVSCIDNLLKGAAGQAVQNMNLMFGFDERAGLQ